eukprot:UN00705
MVWKVSKLSQNEQFYMFFVLFVHKMTSNVQKTCKGEDYSFKNKWYKMMCLQQTFFCLILSYMQPMYSNPQAHEFMIMQTIPHISWLMHQKCLGASNLNSTSNNILQ